ncbi:2-O-methyltransferase NoeI [mine drainage metagenome]|uniref:2-O-methyltransferase NoeI n=1 Tax=mine drainage metagenome TaxID=410659 RepID=A0A1J5S698_9ZZZZ
MQLLPVAITQNERYDRLTKKIIFRVCQPNSVCIDVGAHEGKILKMMIDAAPQASHYAFEPIPELFQSLKQKFHKNEKLFCIALSDKKETTSFNLVLTDMAYSGLNKRAYDKKEKDISIVVETGLLDAIIPATEKIELMKMDVEGAELLVMRGAVQTIQRSKPVLLFEFGKAGAAAYNYNDEDMFQFINETLQYNIYTLQSWLKNKPSLTKQNFSDNYHSGKEYFFLAASK